MENEKTYENISDIRSDINKIKKIARKILCGLDNITHATEDAPDPLQKFNDRLFGNKTSLVNYLVTIAELLCKLEQFEKNTSLYEDSNPMLSQPNLTDQDVALVEMFLSRIKHGPSLTVIKP